MPSRKPAKNVPFENGFFPLNPDNFATLGETWKYMK
jgi:hypothetical protein